LDILRTQPVDLFIQDLIIVIALWPAFRVSLLHLTLIGGFAVVTFTVATQRGVRT
jgi:hypothetical protein